VAGAACASAQTGVWHLIRFRVIRVRVRVRGRARVRVRAGANLRLRGKGYRLSLTCGAEL